MKATQVRIITPTARERASAARPAIMVLAFVIVSFVGIAFLPQAGFNNAPVGIRNPGGDGARALAQVLEHHGITVSEVSAAQAASVDENTTLVVVFPSRMSAQLAQEVETRASVVYVGLEVARNPILGHRAKNTARMRFRRSPACERAVFLRLFGFRFFLHLAPVFHHRRAKLRLR